MAEGHMRRSLRAVRERQLMAQACWPMSASLAVGQEQRDGSG